MESVQGALVKGLVPLSANNHVIVVDGCSEGCTSGDISQGMTDEVAAAWDAMSPEEREAHEGLAKAALHEVAATLGLAAVADPSMRAEMYAALADCVLALRTQIDMLTLPPEIRELIDALKQRTDGGGVEVMLLDPTMLAAALGDLGSDDMSGDDFSGPDEGYRDAPNPN